MIHQTTTQIIFNKHKELKWIEFIEWLEKEKDNLIKHNREEIEIAHFHGSMLTQMASEYFRERYTNWRDGLHTTRACVNQVWYIRLYYNGEMIGNFVSFEEAMDYAEKNYDRATNTIKAN
jgi:hypothetical protein